MVNSTTATHIKKEQANSEILVPPHRDPPSMPYIILREAVLFMHIFAFNLWELGLNSHLIFILPFATPTRPPNN